MTSKSEVDVLNRIKSELIGWPGVTSRPHRFGGTEFRVNGKEMGHVHGARFADLPFPMNVRSQLVAEGKALAHHVLPDSGWVTVPIKNEVDIISLIGLFRMQHERLSAPTSSTAG